MTNKRSYIYIKEYIRNIIPVANNKNVEINQNMFNSVGSAV